MKIQPLAFTTPGWLAFDTFVSSALGSSPIRFLDDNKISPGSLYAYIIALEVLLGTNVKRISHAEASLDHISMSFAVECTENDLLLFNDLHVFKITKITTVRRDEICFIFMTATLKEWKEIVIFNSRATTSLYLREIINGLYHIFHRANLGELFEKYEQTELDDGTFILE